MANTLICCGGTGAHVALAFMRLHALGHPLGFFRHLDGRPLRMPAIYLVDQDHGDGGSQDETAWQALRRVITHHPSRAEWGDAPGKAGEPRLLVVTPLPVGPDKSWVKPGLDRLASRFAGSDYLDYMVSPAQRRIQFSHGMMGSPAVGSLLFRLKTHDLGPDGINHDANFDTLLRQRGRSVVVGSGVGGTGSSVAPTLARTLADRGTARVMAVMVLRWFRLDDDPHELDRETVRRAQARNRDMLENASSGLQYYGASLAAGVATVPVGVPDSALVTRRYAGDTRQPLTEAFPHGVAALCCMLQYLREEPYPEGLYHMGAADPERLGGGNRVPGGTLRSIASQGEVLARTAEVLGEVLATAGERKGPIVPALLRHVSGAHENPGAVGKRLGELAAEYRRHLGWMYEVLGVERRTRSGLTREMAVRGRLHRSPPEIPPGSRAEGVAGELFRWIARWVRDEARNDSELNPRAREAKGIYWPSVLDEGLGGSAEQAGELKKVAPGNISATLEGFVDPRRISQNGWPDAFAAASHFRDAIARRDPTALRRLELLLAGLVEGRLKLREIAHGNPHPVSLDRVVEQERKRCGYAGLAAYGVVEESGGRVFGFSSPRTLLCPVPGVPDSVWGSLWSDLTGFDADDWNPDSPEAWKNLRSWGRCDAAVARIAAWMRACRRRNPHIAPPVWTRIFGGAKPPPTARTGFGAGAELEIDWGGRKIREFLPTRHAGDFHPDDFRLPEGDAERFLDECGKVVDDSGKTRYEAVKFRMPGEDDESAVRGIWRDHLEHLQAEGAIVTYGSDRRSREVYVVIHLEGSPRQHVVLPDTVVLDRETISIGRVVPMLQDPVPGVRGPQPDDPLYPSLPIRSEYVGLVAGPGGRTVLDRFERDGTVEGFRPQFDARRGGDVAVWKLPVLGMRDRLTITLRVPPRESFHKAHWMVWPGFRVLEPRPWRAYYVYGHCTHRRLRLDTLYLEPKPGGAGGGRVLLSRNDRKDHPSYPVGYDSERGVHTGGPPLAFVLRDARPGDGANQGRDEELGLYFVSLGDLRELPERVAMGIDFGTSHSVGAVAVGDDPSNTIELPPELDADGPFGLVRLSGHVSQNWGHVTDPGDGLLSRSFWMPTYVRGARRDLRSLLPTELLTVRRRDAMAGRPVDTWVPMLDFIVPPTGISREDFVHHVIANFKWDTASAFRGHEMALRRIYLDRIVEFFTAEVLARHGRPAQAVDCTFTYPLRTPSDDVEDYAGMLRDVMKRATRSLGCEFRLRNGVGLFDESHATRVGTRRFGEVCMVGDLGGGTLDLIISAQGRPGVRLEEAVDSVRIGGNLLLQTLAGEMGPGLPEGWATNAEARATQLAAWMRTLGSRRLFGRNEGRVPAIRELGLRGFDNAEMARPGRELIHRYFYLVAEYMARSLAAYMGRHWYPRVGPDAWKELRILLYLRGNGWRLWPESSEYRGIEKVVAERVSARVNALWDLLPPGGLPKRLPGGAPGGGDGHPKLDPVRRVVGRSQDSSEVGRDWLSYAMVDLRVLLENGERRIHWHEGVPFKAGGAGVQVQLEGVHPPLPLSSPGADRRLELTGLGESGEFEVNDALARKGYFEELDFHAPVGAWVWEAAFKSRLLRKGEAD